MDPGERTPLVHLNRAVGSGRNVWFKDCVETKWQRVMDTKGSTP